MFIDPSSDDVPVTAPVMPPPLLVDSSSAGVTVTAPVMPPKPPVGDSSLPTASAGVMLTVSSVPVVVATGLVGAMGVDLSKFNPSNYSESIKKKYRIKGPFLLFVGRLSEKKGVKYLIEAMPAVVKKFPDAKLLIIGDGEEKYNLLKQAKETGLLGTNIIFTGAIPNSELPKYYATADIFIGPSIVAKGGDREGFGLVFVEAIGSGCIAISSDAPAISDILIDGKTGFIVKQKSSAGISKKIIELLENKNLYEQIKKEGREYVVKKFDWKVIAKKYYGVLR